MEISEKELVAAVKTSLKKAPYWKLVQDEAKKRLIVIADHFPILGPLFKDAFLASFKYEHALRMTIGKNIPATVPGILFGEEMSEECYQSGITPTKSLLGLDDWVHPNEADVQACIAICHHVNHLQMFMANKSVSDLLLTEPPNPDLPSKFDPEQN